MNNISKICKGALVVRLIMLAMILLLADYLPLGFLSGDIINDDVRYIAGAEIYSQIAHGLIDVNALGNAYLGVNDINIAYGSEFKLWYWMISIFMYLFKSHVVVRVLNIQFAVLCVRVIYDITKKVYGENVGLLASTLYAFMPYPVVFSCFLYKDQFYTLIILLMFREVIQYGKNIKISNVVKLTILVFVSLFLRSGYTVFIGLLLVVIYYTYNKQKISRSQLFFFLVLMVTGLAFVAYYSYDSIERKITFYVLESELPTSGTISFVTIKTYSDLYRYPLALLFAFLLPVNTSGAISSWADLTGLANVVAMPLALGILIYLFNWKCKKDILFWCIQSLYLVTIITSIGIFRHQYYLQPFMMIMFACFYCYLSKGQRSTFLIGSIVVLIMYSFILLMRF